MNEIFRGDNVGVMRRRIRDSSVDLVYLDPPFQSGKDYALAFGRRAGAAHAQEAFRDTWRWGRESEDAYAEVVRAGGSVGRTVEALRTILGGADVMA